MAVLGATLTKSRLSTRAECCAHIGWDDAQQYAAAIETGKAVNTATALLTSHGYFMAPYPPLRSWNKPVWETEWAPFGFQPWDPARGDGSPPAGFTWARSIYNIDASAGAKAKRCGQARREACRVRRARPKRSRTTVAAAPTANSCG